MAAEAKANWAFGASLSYGITALFNAILTVIKETNESVEDFLKGTFGHHWIGHGILVLIVFIILTIVFSYAIKVEELDESKTNIMVYTIFFGTLLSVLIIAGFFAFGE